MNFSKKSFWVIVVVLVVLTADQILKIWVKTHMALLGDIRITDWFFIRFVENSGMAMGIEVPGRLFLVIFRIFASVAIAYYIHTLIKRDFKLTYILCVALIFSGAVGNILDNVFYGVMFSESTTMHASTLFPLEGGYGGWLHGKVVDMFYFPLFEFTWPSWVPWLGGTEFEFFRYIFNIADASISVGIGALVLFFWKPLSLSFEKNKIED
jgi:signal peptidase II